MEEIIVYDVSPVNTDLPVLVGQAVVLVVQIVLAVLQRSKK